MRLLSLTVLAAVLTVMDAPLAAKAQSVLDNLPPPVAGQERLVKGDVVKPAVAQPAPAAAPTPALPTPALPTAAPGTDPYTISNINVDVTADNASAARDQAVMQAQRQAYAALCTQHNVPENVAKADDATIASLVRSFDVQSEKLSAKRYIGVYAVHFKPAAVQKKLGHYFTAPVVVAGEAAAATGTLQLDEAGKAAPLGPVSHLVLSIETPDLAAFAQAKRHILSVPQVARVDVIDLGRGISHVDLSYEGSLDDLRQAMSGQGLAMRQNSYGDWELLNAGYR